MLNNFFRLVPVSSVFISTLFSLSALGVEVEMEGGRDSARSCPQVVVQFSFLHDGVGKPIRGAAKQDLAGLNGKAEFVSDPGVLKTVLLINAAHAIKLTLKGYEEGDEKPHPSLLSALPALPVAVTGPSTFNGIPIFPMEATKAQKPVETETRKARFAKALMDAISRIRTGSRSLGKDHKIEGLFARMEKLAANISNNPDYHDGSHHHPNDYMLESVVTRGGVSRGLESLSFSTPKSMTLQSGGIQDAGAFWSQVEAGSIPSAKEFPIDGYLKEFEMPLLNDFQSQQLVSARPGVAFIPATGHLYVQVEIAAAIDEATYQRPPLNIAFAVDISGSMTGKDGTPYTRLEWAKKVLLEMLNPPQVVQGVRDNYLRLTEEDAVSFIVFDDEAEIVLPAAMLTLEHRQKLVAAINGMKTRGSTDVLKALKMAYEQIDGMSFKLPGGVNYDNRAFILTDCGNNTGSSNAELVSEVQKAGASGKSLTVIGLGADGGLNDSLAQKLGDTPGGFYYYASSGKYLEEFVANGNTRLSPFATNFKAAVTFEGFPVTPRLIRSYGVNEDPQAPRNQVINIPTLRFSDEAGGGGGIILVYDTNPETPATP